MSAIKRTATRKAAKAAAKHTARGTASKLKRNPLRAATLLGLGGAIGAVIGWLVGRNAAGVAPDPSSFVPARQG